jgi:hypothetical protein
MIISHPPTPHLSKYHTDQSRSTPIDSNASSDHQSFNKFFDDSPTHLLTHSPTFLKYKGLVAAPKIDWNGLRERRAAAGFFVDSLHSINPSLRVFANIQN